MKGKTFLYTGLVAVHLVLIVLFFDLKVHIGGDDSDYIIAALDFWEGRAFPGWHGSLYPILLSPLVGIFGVNLLVLKMSSVALVVGSFYFLHKTFFNRLPTRAYNFALAITACSYGFAVYASTTYSEPLFLFLQSLILFVFVKILDNETNTSYKHWGTCVLLSFLVFCLSITRNVGFGAVIALVLIFLISKKWKIAAILSVGFAGFHLLFSQYKHTVWNISQSGIEGQFSKIKYKSFYDPSEGTEDLTGFFIRFWDNSNLYLSKHLARLLGIRFFGDTISPSITILFFLLFGVALFLSVKKNRMILFMTLYVGIMLAATFITQQTHWDQERLIIIYLTLIAAILGWLLNALVESKVKAISISFSVVMVGLPLVVLFQSILLPKSIFNSIDAMFGKPYSGYPIEWKNYASMCEWVGKNIPQNKNVLCRKAGIARVYGGRKFHGISHFYHVVPDSADALLKRQEIDYVILDDLDMPTVERMLTYYLSKYPFGLEVEKTFGNTRQSVLLKVSREKPQDEAAHFKRVEAGLLVCPEHSYFYFAKGELYAHRNDFSNALSYYSTALTMRADDTEKFGIQFQRARVLIQLQEFDRAQRDAEDLVTKSPKSKNAWHLLAYIHQLKGNQTEAKKFYNKAMSL